MANIDDLVEAFDDLGYSLEDPKVIDRLTSLCDLYGIDENKISCEYLAFAKKKQFNAPNLEIIEQFESDILSGLKDHLKKNASRNVFDSTTIGNLTSNHGKIVDEDDEEDVLGCYGSTPKRKKTSTAKRQISPDSAISKKRFGNNETFSPDSFAAQSQTPTSQGKKYSARDNAGKVLIRFGDTINQEVWTNMSNYYRPEMKMFDTKKVFPTDYRFMFERLREKAGYLDETICRIGDVLQTKHTVEEPMGFGPPMPEPFPTLGRICCDSEGRLNANSILLQGTQDMSRGRTLPLDVSQVKEYSLFPGQVVHTSVTNPSGTKLIGQNLTYDASSSLKNLSSSSTKINLKEGDTMHVVIACGPFTTSDNLAYEPFKDFLDYIGKTRPNVVILSGPFVDSKQAQIDQVQTGSQSFDEIFQNLIKMLEDLLKDLPNTQIILQPSIRDVHHRFIYPTPEFTIAESPGIMTVSDPALVNIDGLIFGLTSTDILFHLGKEEISYPPRSGDRIRRLVNHLIHQRSFYPLYPPSEEMNIDYEQLETLGQLDVQPDVLVLPSDLLHFFKDVNGGLVLNPQRLTKGAGGGVFARLAIHGPTAKNNDDNCPITKRINAEIVRI